MTRGLLQLYGTSNSFTPAQLSSTVSWWDASKVSSATVSGTQLTVLADLMGHANMLAAQESNTIPMDYGLRTVRGLNVASAVHKAFPLRSMSSPGWQTGFPGAEGTIYIVCQVDISWDSQGPAIFIVCDSWPVPTKATILLSQDHYHLYWYPGAAFNNVTLSRHGIESFNSWMDGLPHVYKLRWSASTGDVALVGDGGLIFPSATGTGYTTLGTTTHNGIEIGISNQDQGGSQGTFQFCEMTLHNSVIADGSSDDNKMLTYFRQKWKTPGQPISSMTSTHQGELSAGAVLNAISIATDGALFIAPNNNPNCFRWNSGVNAQFDNVFTQSRVPAAAQAWGQGAPKCLDLAVAPSNSNRVYAVVSSLGSTTVWKSTDSGTTWTDTGHAVPFSSAPGAGPCMAIDPSDPTKVMIGCSNGHIHQSTDSGANWTDRTITGGGTSYPCIVFESTTSIYLGWLAGATNVLHSSDSGANFSSPASSGPTTVRGLAVSGDGVVYACDNGGGTTNGWKLASATWSNFTGAQITATGGTWAFPAAEGSSGHIAFCSTTGLLQYSANYGVAWQYGTSPGTAQTQTITAGPTYNLDSSGDVAWLVSPFLPGTNSVRPPNFGCNNSYACSRILFDPSSAGKLWLTCATGLYYVTPSTYNGATTPAVDWFQQNKNQQGLQVNDICRAPIQSGLMNNILFVNKLKSGMATNAPRTGPTFFIGGPLSDDGLCCDYAKNLVSTQFILTASAFWKSIDYGADGFCAADGTTNMGAVPGIDSAPMMVAIDDLSVCILSGTGKKYTTTATTNGTPTWLSCSGLPGASASNGRSHVLVNDGVTAATLYALIPSNGVYKSTDGGANWSQQTASSAALPTSYAQGSQLSNAPGQTGHLWFAGGNTGALPLARSTDGGVNWSAISNVTEAWQVSVGATKSGATYPTIFITGKIQGDSDPGVFRSTDTAATWTRVCRAPGGNLDAPNKIFADLDNYGTFFVSMGTTGYCFGELDYA